MRLAAILVLLSAGCSVEVPRESPSRSATPDKAAEPSPVLPSPPPLSLTYHLEPKPDSPQLLTERFTTEQLSVLEKLNRADLEHLPRLKEIVVPDHWDYSELAYSPLPMTYPSAQETPKVLVVYIPGQIFGAYEYGQLVRWGPVSSGADVSPTPEGLYHLNWKSKGRHSTVDEVWYMPWYFNFENREGRAFHVYLLPGFPGSHTCIRLLERDAQWLYGWGEQWALDEKGWNPVKYGTPVLITGHYAFDQPPLWRSLDWLSNQAELPALPSASPPRE